MIWAVLAVALWGLTATWMVHVVNDRRPRSFVGHAGRALLVPAGIFLSAALAVQALAALQNGLPL